VVLRMQIGPPPASLDSVGSASRAQLWVVTDSVTVAVESHGKRQRGSSECHWRAGWEPLVFECPSVRGLPNGSGRPVGRSWFTTGAVGGS
jgi:hypothetical protein